MSKKMLMEALSTVDEKIATPAVLEQISEAFDSAVLAQSEAKVKELQESLVGATEEYSKKIVESHVVDLKEKFEKAVSAKAAELLEKELTEAHQTLQEKHDAEIKQINEDVEKYVQFAVDQFVKENKSTWEDEIAVKKAEAIMESAVGFAQKFSIELNAITSDEETKKILDESVSENAALKAEISQMKREKILDEACKGLSVVKIDKLKTLVEGLEFNAEFEKKVDLFKQTLVETSNEAPIDESAKNRENSKKRSWE